LVIANVVYFCTGCRSQALHIELAYDIIRHSYYSTQPEDKSKNRYTVVLVFAAAVAATATTAAIVSTIACDDESTAQFSTPTSARLQSTCN